MSRRFRIIFSCLIGLSSGLAFASFAREIDSEKTVSTEQIQLGQTLPKTLVVRVQDGTNQIEVLHLNEALNTDEASHRLVSSSSFARIDSTGRMVGELDRDSSSSSWIFRLLPPPGGYGRSPVNRTGGIPGDRSPGDNTPGDTSPGRDLPRDDSPGPGTSTDDESPDDRTPGDTLPGGSLPSTRAPDRHPSSSGSAGRASPGYGHSTSPRYGRSNPPAYRRSEYPRYRYGGSRERRSDRRSEHRSYHHRTRHYTPHYRYRGYSYRYAPYHSYWDNGYYYEYYGWRYTNRYCPR